MNNDLEMNKIASFDNLCNTVTGVDKAFADNTAKAINKNDEVRKYWR